MTSSLCRIYVTIAPNAAAETLEENLSELFAAGDVACLRLRTGDNAAVFDAFARKAIPVAHGHDVAVLVEDDAALARDLEADGVHLTGDLSEYTAAREVLGDDRIVGIDCAESRHKAMAAGESGADYITLSAGDPQTIAWWTEVFQIPCVADIDPSAHQARDVIADGVEFVSIDCSHDKGLQDGAAAVSQMGRLITEIGRELE